MKLLCWALLLVLILILQHIDGAPVNKEHYRMSASILQALSDRGTLILESALKTALQALDVAVKEQEQYQKVCNSCVPCLFPECTNSGGRCRGNFQPEDSEPTCDVILEAHANSDPLERSWSMSQVCSFYHQLCPEGNLTEDKCIQATAGRCQLKLEECKLEMTMDYLNTSPEDGSPVTCGQKFSSTSNNTIAKGRIVGGSVTSPGSWPWLVNLRLNGDLMCGGVLLDDMWILTAAHCFTGNVNLLQWTVVVGQYDLSKKVQGEKTFQVNRIVTHPKFNQKTFDNDLALLELTSSVTASESARPVCLPPVPIDPAPGTNCYIAGWGSLYEDGPLSDVIMEAHVPVLSQEACRGTLGKDMLTSTMFCAGYLTGGIDSCQGDSGGPLTCQDPISKQYVLYGITSWGDGCGERGKPGIYTRPTCFELSELGILHEKGISSLCSFYRTLCPVPLSQEACTRLTEERCKQKQRRCELHSYLQTLLSLLRRAEHFLRDNMDFSFFTQTIPQFMEQVYSNIFTSRVRRDIQVNSSSSVILIWPLNGKLTIV
ncbi:hypothetical protein XELAEV_18003272mg [Xenopus laevis]|nr:hypothetical protein XELAEV_18003272mg [Xenopus laevis]